MILCESLTKAKFLVPTNGAPPPPQKKKITVVKGFLPQFALLTAAASLRMKFNP
jgi:hypothetical protein